MLVAIPGKAEGSVRGRDPTVKALEVYDMGARGSEGRREGRRDDTPSNHGPFYTFEETLDLYKAGGRVRGTPQAVVGHMSGVGARMCAGAARCRTIT